MVIWHKVLAFIAIIGAIVWLGGSGVRAVIAFDLFVPGTLTEFRPGVSAAAQVQSLYVLGLTGIYTMIGYSMTIISCLILFWVSRPMWKKQGWIIVAGILLFLYIPVEVLQMLCDLRLGEIAVVGSESFPLERARMLLVDRYTIPFEGASALAVLGYITAIVMIVWRPLVKEQKTMPEVSSGL